MQTGLPPKVLKWIRCVSASAISRRVVTAASGAPLPMPLAMVTMSGVDAPVLEAPVVVAGAAEAGLHLVGDAEPAVLADDGVGLPQVVRRADGSRRRRPGSARR